MGSPPPNPSFQPTSQRRASSTTKSLNNSRRYRTGSTRSPSFAFYKNPASSSNSRQQGPQDGTSHFDIDSLADMSLPTIATKTTSISLDSQEQQQRLSNTTAPWRSSRKPRVTTQETKLGTLHGVFLPCLQNILGVILFLRLTNITGQAGCIYTTLIVLISVASTLLTALSLSAIATNGTIPSGGPYYVISRTLGVEIGGALGLLYYLGTTLATTMYILGAVEAIQRTVDWPWLDARWASLLLMWLVASIVSIGVNYVNMTSSTLLVLVLASIVSMTFGCLLFAVGAFQGLLEQDDRVLGDNLWPHYQPDPVTGTTPSFFALLAIFYPSVTGILAGSNRSAVLASPEQSIPRGTLGAIGITTSIYLLTIWLFGMTIANATLIHDKFVVAAVAWPLESIVAAGVIFSSVGAALQTCAGAPRVLAAIAMDDALPCLSFLKSSDESDEPTRAIWFTWLLASIATLAGNIDHITPLVTTFFLLMYSGINLSCFLLGFLKSPGFRPTFSYFHWSISLVGCVWCLGLVALVARWYTVLAVTMVFVSLYLYTKQQKKVYNNWGDVGNAIRHAIAIHTLRALAATSPSSSGEDVMMHAKNWRPQLLTVVDTDDCGNPTHLHVLTLAQQLKQGGGGVHMVMSFVERPFGVERYETCELMAHCKRLLERHMEARQLQDCFSQVAVTTSTASQALCSAVVHSSLGPLSPNAVLMSYPQTGRSPQSMDDYVVALRGIMNLQKAIILFQGTADYSSIRPSTIDVWWVVHDGGLLLLLPYILSKHELYSTTQLRLFAVMTSPRDDPERLCRAVNDHLARVRITATVQVVDLSNTTIAQDMRETDETCSSISHLRRNTKSDIRAQHNMTVGEVFSDHNEDALDLDDIELGTRRSISDSTTTGSLNQSEKDSTSLVADQDDRLQTACTFNKALRLHSSQSSLVVTNMPLIRCEQSGNEFFEYVDAVCQGIDNILLVRGSGVEVITTYA